MAAADVRLRYDPGELTFVAAAPLQATMLVQAYDDEKGSVTLGLVATAAQQGEILQVTFRGASGPEGVALVAARAFDEEGQGVAPPQLRPSSGSPPHAAYDPWRLASALSDAHESLQLAEQPALEASFADHPLGDMNRDGVIDVRDALALLRIATGRSSESSAYQGYHGDLDGDGKIDVLDVLALLTKAVDPTLEAQLRVAPKRVSFAYLHAGRPLLVGNAGNAPLPTVGVTPTQGLSATKLAAHGLIGQSAAYTLGASASWKFGAIEVKAGAAGSSTVPVGNLALLIAGQSSASGRGEPLSGDDPDRAIARPGVRLFGNDYFWKAAYEPLDDPTNQVDGVSADWDRTNPSTDCRPTPYECRRARHSFGVSLGNALQQATGRDVYLIPSALGGSPLRRSGEPAWYPEADRLDRTTLFGSANYRAQVSAGWLSSPYPAQGGPVAALVWYQGESEVASQSRRDVFMLRTNAVMDAFVQELRSPHILYVQLAVQLEEDFNRNQQVIREYQRLMETGAQLDTGSGPPQPRQRFYMIVAHDLPLSDEIHLSAEGQRILGERIALAFRQHVLGENVNGTGPRLVSVTQPASDQVKVKTTRPINDHPTYEHYFSVRDEAGEVPISSLGRDPNDVTAVLIRLARPTDGKVTVRYMPPTTARSIPGSSTSSRTATACRCLLSARTAPASRARRRSAPLRSASPRGSPLRLRGRRPRSRPWRASGGSGARRPGGS